MKAIFNKKVIAESDKTVVVEGNHYFPPASIKKKYFKPSDERSVCYWKGDASYYNVEVEGEVSPGGAWYYPHPSHAAARIKDYVAFWRGVEVTD